jgi:hypothetical protein
MAIPAQNVLAEAAKVALKEDKYIGLDYYQSSMDKSCCIGVQDDVKYLIKSGTEYTSPIQSIMRLKEDNVFFVITENSLYIVSSAIPVKKIVGGAQVKQE